MPDCVSQKGATTWLGIGKYDLEWLIDAETAVTNCVRPSFDREGQRFGNGEMTLVFWGCTPKIPMADYGSAKDDRTTGKRSVKKSDTNPEGTSMLETITRRHSPYAEGTERPYFRALGYGSHSRGLTRPFRSASGD